ncbi:MAG: flippase-like domain-containing protein [Sedimentisphaerales bacterium]|nr:flippase-like domain-containing protein [Sedimentisphaerales bacterium]
MPKTKTRKSKRIFLFLRIAVVMAGVIWGIVWVAHGDTWSQLTSIFHRMNLGVYAATLGIFIVGQVIVGFRWWLLLRTQSIFIDLAAAVRLNFLGWFYNNFMPGSVGGDLLKAWYVTMHTEKRFEAALSVFVDRIIGLFSTLLIAVFFYILFLRNREKAVTFTGRTGLIGLFIEYKWYVISVVLILVMIFCGILLHKKGRILLLKAWFYIKIYTVRIFGKCKNAFLVYSGSPLTIFMSFLLTVSSQIVVITSFWFLGKSLGITAGLKYYYVFFTLTWVLGALPVSVGGAGVVEGTLYCFFVNCAGVGEEMAFALVMCQRTVWMLASLPGAVIHLVGAHLPRDFFIDSDKPVV